MSGWPHIIGIGESGIAGLAAPAVRALEEAEIILGGDRHPNLTRESSAERIGWPAGFDELLELIESHKNRRMAILVVGDPLWYSIGARIARALDGLPITFHPQISAFQFAACRLGWSMADIDLVTIFGRAKEQIIPYFQPHARILTLAQNGQSPRELADMLIARDMGDSQVTALWHLGGADEGSLSASAREWRGDVPDFLVVAIECRLQPGTDWLHRGPGLPENAFRHNGRILPPELRAATLAKLAPRRGACLWHIGAGCGDIAIEWMRLAPEARAVAVERSNELRDFVTANALALGAPKLAIEDDWTPDKWPAPNAICISEPVEQRKFDALWEALLSGGHMVGNALDDAAARPLEFWRNQIGGKLVRLSIQTSPEATPQHLTQWHVTKPSQ